MGKEEKRKMKTKYYVLKALTVFKNNFFKYLSLTALTIAVLLIFYVLSAVTLISFDFGTIAGYIIFIITAVIFCLLLNPILEGYVFAIDLTKDVDETKNTADTKVEYVAKNSSYVKNFMFGLKHKLRIQNRGSVKVLKNIVRSVLIYLALLFVSQLITLLVFSFTNETAYELYNTYLFGSGITEEEYEVLLTYITNPLLISNVISLLIAFLSYFYFLFIYLFKSSLGNSYYMILKSNRIANVDETYKENKAVFRPAYSIIVYVILFMFSVIFVCSYFLFYYYAPIDNLVVITETALFIGIVFIMLFVPAIFELYKTLKITFNVYFVMSFITYIQVYLRDLSNESYESFEEKERAEFFKKLYRNDLNQVLSFGNLYYLQLNLEYDLYKQLDGFVDEEEIIRIRTYMNNHQVIFKELNDKKEEK